MTFHVPMDLRFQCLSSPREPRHKKPRFERFCQGNTKVCIVFHCVKRNKQHVIYDNEYNICIVDLLGYDDDVGVGPDDFTRCPPFFRINCGPVNHFLPAQDAFCLLGNKLYIFEGDRSNEPSPRKSIYSIDMSSALSYAGASKTLMKSELPKVGEMLSPKPFPVAVVAPGGQKILVFSNQHWVRGFYDVIDCFELFDTVEGFSLRLPSIGTKHSHYVINSFGFFEDTKFLVNIGLRMYVLDFNALDKGWACTNEILSGVEGFPTSLFFEILEGRFCVGTTYGIYDLQAPKEEEDSCTLDPLMMTQTTSTINIKHSDSDDDDEEYWVDYLVTLLNHSEQNGECWFCELRVERIEECQLFVRFQLDVAIADLKQYKQDLDHLACTRGVKSFQFSLNLDRGSIVQDLRNFFSFLTT